MAADAFVKKKLTQESTNTLVKCNKMASERCYTYILLPEAGTNLRKTVYIKTTLWITIMLLLRPRSGCVQFVAQPVRGGSIHVHLTGFAGIV